jgi:hypothetical protein
MPKLDGERPRNDLVVIEPELRDLRIVPSCGMDLAALPVEDTDN